MRKHVLALVCALLGLSLAVSSFAMSDTDSVYLASADTAAVSLDGYEASEYTPAQLALSIDPVATSSGGVELLAVGLYDYGAAVVYQGTVYNVQWNEGGGSYRVKLYDNSSGGWSSNGTTLADNVFNYGAVLMSVIATDISNNPGRAAAFATALTPYLTEAGVGGGATIEEISNFFSSDYLNDVVSFDWLGSRIANSTYGLFLDGTGALTIQSFGPGWVNPSGNTYTHTWAEYLIQLFSYGPLRGLTTGVLNYSLTTTGFFSGEEPIQLAYRNVSFLRHLVETITNSGFYTLTTPFKPNGFLGITFNGQSAELTADIQDSSLEYILNALYYGDRLQAERWYWNGSTSGTTFTNLSMTDDEAQAYNFRSLGQFLNSEFADVATDFAVTRSHLSDLTGSGSVTSHTVTDEGIETTDTTYDTIIGALTAATNDTNNLLSGLSYIFASPADIAAKQATIEDEKVISDSVYGDEGLLDVDSVTDVVGIGSGLADLMPDNVSPDDFFSSADSDELWSWFSDETAASIDQTTTSFSRSAPSYDDYYHPFDESKYNLGSFLASLGGD